MCLSQRQQHLGAFPRFGFNHSPCTRASKWENLRSKLHQHTPMGRLNFHHLFSYTYESTSVCTHTLLTRCTHGHVMLKILNCTGENRKLPSSLTNPKNEGWFCNKGVFPQAGLAFISSPHGGHIWAERQVEQPASGSGWFQMLRRCSRLVFLNRIKS